jgi:hypothetical protein
LPNEINSFAKLLFLESFTNLKIKKKDWKNKNNEKREY